MKNRTTCIIDPAVRNRLSQLFGFIAFKLNWIEFVNNWIEISVQMSSCYFYWNFNMYTSMKKFLIFFFFIFAYLSHLLVSDPQAKFNIRSDKHRCVYYNYTQLSIIPAYLHDCVTDWTITFSTQGHLLLVNPVCSLNEMGGSIKNSRLLLYYVEVSLKIFTFSQYRT